MSTQFQTWRPKPRRRSELLARIDATPLFAIFLAILWLLMFPSAVVRHSIGRNVDLAYANSATPHPAALREDSIHLAVTRDGALLIPGNNYFPGSRVSPGDLPATLRSMMHPGVERRVYISADARLKYGDVKGALNLIREAGISDVTLLVEGGTLPASMRR